MEEWPLCLLWRLLRAEVDSVGQDFWSSLVLVEIRYSGLGR